MPQNSPSPSLNSYKQKFEKPSFSQTDPQEPDLKGAIRQRAEEIYRRTGRLNGRDLENWQTAQAEILRETAPYLCRPAIVVNLEGVVYTGEYDGESSGDYMPGEWTAGELVPARVVGDRLFLRRRNGIQLETEIVKRLG